MQEAGKANQRISDPQVLAFATQQERAVLTLNRRDFIRLHKQNSDHAGIVVAKDDADKILLAERINAAIEGESQLRGKLIRVTKHNKSS